jgi:hypothetical protein
LWAAVRVWGEQGNHSERSLPHYKTLKDLVASSQSITTPTITFQTFMFLIQRREHENHINRRHLNDQDMFSSKETGRMHAIWPLFLLYDFISIE